MVELELPESTGPRPPWATTRRTGSAAGVDPLHPLRGGGRLHPAARDLLHHRWRAGRPHPGHARHPAAARGAGRERRHQWSDLPRSVRPGAATQPRRDARGAGPAGGRLGALGASPRASPRAARTYPHAVLDAATGELHLGPAVNAGDGTWQQYGRVPAKGALLRMSGYRTGGGRQGNVAAGTLTVLKSSIPGVASVTNPIAATGGVDAETLDDARVRAPLELRSRYRAVTVEDFQALAAEASRQVARVHCIPPDPDDGLVRLRILPMVEDSARKLELHELTPSDELLAQVAADLDPRRMVGTRVHLAPVTFRGVSVVVDVQVSQGANPGRVESDIERALHTYLNPLIGGNPHGVGGGWEFGRALNQGELFGVVHQVAGVEFVKILRVYETDLATGKQDTAQVGSHLELAGDELVASGTHIVKATHREDSSDVRPATNRDHGHPGADPSHPDRRRRRPAALRVGPPLPALAAARHLPRPAARRARAGAPVRPLRGRPGVRPGPGCLHPGRAAGAARHRCRAVSHAGPDGGLAGCGRGRAGIALRAPRDGPLRLRDRQLSGHPAWARAGAADGLPQPAAAGRRHRRGDLLDAGRLRPGGRQPGVLRLLRHAHPGRAAGRGGTSDRTAEAGQRAVSSAREEPARPKPKDPS